MNEIHTQRGRGPLDRTLCLFDMGNVVVRNVTTMEKIADHYRLPFAELLEDYKKYEFPLMDGSIPSEVYWKHAEGRFGIKVHGDPLADFFHPVWNPPVVELIGWLRSLGKRIVCASNTYAPHWKILQEQGFLAVFDQVYASHELGVTKPSRQFFERILEAEKSTAEQACFVDDYLENIVAAERVGILSCHYSDGEGLLADRRLANFFGFAP